MKLKVYPLSKPDINIVNYVLNIEGNRDLEKMNRLNEFVADKILGYLPDERKTMLDKKFIVSSTDFCRDEYGDSPVMFLEGLGFSKEEWLRVKKVKVLRSVIMSPYLTPDYVDENYVGLFLDYLQEELSRPPGFLPALLTLP